MTGKLTASLRIGIHPSLELVNITHAGMVLLAPQSYLPGTTLALGMHLHEACPETCHHFASLEGIVVACQPGGSHPHGILFEITIVFPHLSEDETGLIEEANRLCSAHTSPAHTAWRKACELEKFAGLN